MSGLVFFPISTYGGDKSKREEILIMDESSFELDSTQIRRLTAGYPRRHHDVPVAHPDADLSYMKSSTGADFRGHCWDESGY